MLRRAATICTLIAMATSATPAAAHMLPYRAKCHSLSCVLKAQTRNLNHVRYVARHGRGEPKRWSIHAIVWLTKARNATRAAIERAQRPKIDACTMEIIRREASGFDPTDRSTWRRAATRPNSRGSGAYGVPQALPGSKMASHGADWATNPWTQIRWMIDYETSNYGSPCGALSFWNAHGWY